MASTLDFLKRLSEHGVEFVVVGGLAGVIHGSCRVLNLDALIRARRALGRPKDLQAEAELEAIRERVRGGFHD